MNATMKSKGLSKVQLQLIAIAAMVTDHIAWGFMDNDKPVALIMHVFGRLTIPIMCFFIAEGFSHTRDIKKYVLRMAIFAAISILPFYLFFHEEYGYRQNIIFDELIALLALIAWKKADLKKPVRILLVILMFIISATLSGWPIMPVIYVLVFGLNDKFKDKAKLFCLFTCILVISVVTLIITNRMFHYMSYDWSMWQSIYLAGFMLALIPLSKYNGEKGELKLGRYFFYIFYPTHFMVLYLIKHFIIR